MYSTTFDYSPRFLEWYVKYHFKLYSVYKNYSLEKVTFKLPVPSNINQQIKFN